MVLKTTEALDVKGKHVLVRVSFGKTPRCGLAENSFAIQSVLPTLRNLAKRRAKVLIISHLAAVSSEAKAPSLERAASDLAAAWQRKLVVVEDDAKRLPEYEIPHLYFFKGDFQKDSLGKLCEGMRDGDAMVLENLASYPSEAAADEKFAKKLAALASAFVNEAFVDAPIETASLRALPGLLPHAFGENFAKEYSYLERIRRQPKRPVVLMLGGSDVEHKLDLLEGLAGFADVLLLGGAFANLFLRLQGYVVGKSAGLGKSFERVGREVWRNYKDKIFLPADVVVSSRPDGEPECVSVGKMKASQAIYDIGPETIKRYSSLLRRGQTLIWNGPLGCYERSSFSHGTRALGWLMSSRSKTAVVGLAAGGSTLEVARKLHLDENFDYLSPAGQTMLYFLAGKPLPALA